MGLMDTVRTAWLCIVVCSVAIGLMIAALNGTFVRKNARRASLLVGTLMFIVGVLRFVYR
jgi:hypothetical protein